MHPLLKIKINPENMGIKLDKKDIKQAGAELCQAQDQLGFNSLNISIKFNGLDG